MYGTIFRMKVKEGQIQEVVDLFEAWHQDIKPGVTGALYSHVMKPDDKENELVAIAIFNDSDTYREHAEMPDQIEWHQSLRMLLTDDPQWEDGAFLVSS